MASFSLVPIFVFTIAAFVACILAKTSFRWKIVAAISCAYLFLLNPSTALIFLGLACLNYFLTSKKIVSDKLSHQLLIGFNVIFLLFFKCAYLLGNQPSTILPLGISVFVFQQISFLIENMHQKLGNLPLKQFMTYSFFWGNLATGPIINFLDVQEKDNQLTFNSKALNTSIVYVLFGLFKIFVIAGHLSKITSPLFFGLHRGKTDLLIPFLFNKYEIYANFSGYTDIALGIGFLFGINLPKNFNRPFQTDSIAEFWKRWHMSLSQWIRHYVFYPLLTTRFAQLGVYAVLTVTFTIFALWHGFKITFILYGFIQVALLFFSHQWRKKFQDNKTANFLKPLKWLWFYIVLISIPGLLFRSENVSDFYLALERLTTTTGAGLWLFVKQNLFSLLIVIAAIGLIEVSEYFSLDKIAAKVSTKKTYVKLLIFILTIVVIIVAGHINSRTGFIYSAF